MSPQCKPCKGDITKKRGADVGTYFQQSKTNFVFGNSKKKIEQYLKIFVEYKSFCSFLSSIIVVFVYKSYIEFMWEGVTLIENVAFWWNPRLEQVDFPTSLPIDLYSEYEKGEFEKMVSQYDIFVPSHLIDAYRQHPHWSKCRSINSL